jgi:hypothetical protein
MDSHVGSFTIDEGVDAFGTRTQIIFDGDQVVKKQTYDATPLIKEAEIARIITSGDKWGEGLGTRVGTIPMAELDIIKQKYKSTEERGSACIRWLRDNPKLVTFDKFLK